MALPGTRKKWTLQGPTQINGSRSCEKTTNLCFNKSHDADPSKSPLSVMYNPLVSLIALWCCTMKEKYSSLNCTLVPKTPFNTSSTSPFGLWCRPQLGIYTTQQILVSRLRMGNRPARNHTSVWLVSTHTAPHHFCGDSAMGLTIFKFGKQH